MIFTDFDQAALGGIREVFPGALNKLCFWHTMENVREHGKGLRKGVLAEVLRLFKGAAYAPTEEVRVVELGTYNVYATCVKSPKNHGVVGRAFVGERESSQPHVAAPNGTPSLFPVFCFTRTFSRPIFVHPLARSAECCSPRFSFS